MELNLKPAPRMVIKKPDGSKLAADGEKVPRTSFWLKRLADGDVLPVEEAQAEQEDVKPAAKAPKKPRVKE